MAVLSSYAEVPRWACLDEALEKVCFINELKLEMKIKKHLLRETIFFKIEGDYEVLCEIQKWLKSLETDV